MARDRLAADSTDPGVVRQRSRGKLTCRERIEMLLDDRSFSEIGSIAGFASHDPHAQKGDVKPLFDIIVKHVPGPSVVAPSVVACRRSPASS